MGIAAAISQMTFEGQPIADRTVGEATMLIADELFAGGWLWMPGARDITGDLEAFRALPDGAKILVTGRPSSGPELYTCDGDGGATTSRGATYDTDWIDERTFVVWEG